MLLTLFAKYPEPGKVKTRLEPYLGRHGCEQLAWKLIQWSLENVLESWPGSVRLAVWPPQRCAEMSSRVGVETVAQVEGDIGRKMAAVWLEQEVDGPHAVMGCDVPHCPGETLQQAASALSGGDNVIGPAADGGFYLLGGEFREGLFDSIEWSTGTVRATLLNNYSRLGMAHPLELQHLRDIDTGEDLQHVSAGFEPLRQMLCNIIGPGRQSLRL